MSDKKIKHDSREYWKQLYQEMLEIHTDEINEGKIYYSVEYGRKMEKTISTLTTRLAAVEESLEFARNYSGIEGRPCPLCTYEDGVFIKSCQMHTDLAAVEKERDEWKRSSELVARVLIDTKADLATAMKVVETAI